MKIIKRNILSLVIIFAFITIVSFKPSPALASRPLRVGQVDVEIKADQTDFKANESPSFTLIKSEAESAWWQKLISFITTSLKPSTTVSKVSVTLINAKGDKISQFDLDLSKDQSRLNFDPQNLHLTPGAYTVEITPVTEEKSDQPQISIKQDFTWGVLAVNTNKSIYRPNELSRLSFAVLNKLGKMVCDAQLELKITNKQLGINDSLSSKNGRIKVNQECRKKEVTQKADYEGFYTVGKAGLYQMELTAKTSDGSHSIKDVFEVRDNPDFDVERAAATRILPTQKYPVEITVTADKDFSGQIEETVPRTFEISELDPINSLSFKVKESENQKKLVWRVNLKKNEPIRLAYQYDAPDKSPEFYLLGPLRIRSENRTLFVEKRQWQIASDATFSIQTGYYIGTGVDNLAITGVGFQPNLVMIKDDSAAGNDGLDFKISAMSGETSSSLGDPDADTASNAIQSFDADGFTVGSSAETNTSKERYEWIAFGGSDCTSTGTFCVGSYTGNGQTTQAITSVGFQPDLVVVKRSGATNAVWRSSAMATNVGNYFANTAEDTSGALFTTLDSTGFTVGNNAAVNTSSNTYWFFAFKTVTGALKVSSYTANGTDNTNITGVGFVPDVLWVKLANDLSATPAQQVAALNITESFDDYSMFFTDVVNRSNDIQKLQTDGFQIGTRNEVNLCDGTPPTCNNKYYYVAFAGATNPTGSGTFKMATNSYSGTGSAKSISGLGFAPDLVIIKQDTTSATSMIGSVFRTRLMPGDTTATMSAALGDFTAGITSLDSDGFTVGTDASVNENGNSYHWTAFGNAYNPMTGSGASDFTIGEFVGSASDDRNIQRLPFQPNLVVVKTEGLDAGLWKTSAISGEPTMFFSATADTATNLIQAFNSDGFQVGSANGANRAANLIHFFAFKSGSNMAVNSYTGDGTSAQNITTPGFQPNLVWIKRSTGVAGVHRPSSLNGDSTQFFNGNANTAGCITGFISTGFTVNTCTSAGETNTSGGTYRYAAWKIPINISGTIYLENETTTATSGNGGQCDGSTANLSLRVNGAAASTTSCSSSDGSFTFSSITASAGDTITIYSTATDKSNRVYVSDGSSDTGMNLYKNAVAIGDEQDGTVTILDLLDYDNDQDATNMLFDADDLATDALTVESGVELHVHTGDTFDPGGTVDTNTTGGDVHLDDSASMYIDTATSTIGADALVDTGATLYFDANANIDGGDITLSGTGSVNTSTGTPTVTLSGGGTIGGGTGTLTFYNLTIDSTGTTTLNAALTLNNNLTVGDGTNAHTLDIETNDKTVDVNGSVTIAANGTLTASSTGTFTVAGSWTNNGTLTEGTGTITFDSSTAATLNSGCSNVDSCTTQNFYNLTINKSAAGNTVTLSSNHLRLTNTLTITTGTFTQSSLNVRAEGTTAVSIGANGTWSNTSTGDIKLAGNVSNSGTVTLQANATCGGTDDIVITAVSGTPSWSGSGTYTFKDTSISSQNAAVAITVFSGTDAGSNTGSWTFTSSCVAQQSNNKFTLSAWVNPSTSIASKAILVKNAEIRLVTDASGNPLCQTSNASSWQTAVTSSTAITTGSWQHVACSYDQTNLLIFVNGVQTGSQSLSATIDDTSNAWRLGSDAGGTYGDYNGKMDEVRIYSRALSEAEVRQLYNFSLGTVAYLKMDESSWTGTCSGTPVIDASGNANHANACPNASAPSPAQAKFGRGASLDGSNDYLSIPDSASLDLTSGVSITSWVYIDTNKNYNQIITKGADASEAYEIFIDSTGAVSGDWLFSGGRVNCVSSGSTTLSTATWYHIGVTYDSASCRTYINGVLVNTNSISSTSTSTNASAVEIGGDTSTSGRYFDGFIDELRIYNYARSAKEIIEDMNIGHPAPGSPVGSPVGYWKIDEGSGTTVNDTTENNNDLTMSTASWATGGKFNKAWNGTGALWMSRADDSDFDFLAAEDFSISLWFKSDSATNPGSNEYLVDKEAGTGYGVYFDTSGRPVFGIDSDGVWTPADTATTTTDYYDASWHHLVAIKTATSKIELFIDGKSVGSDTSISATGTLANADSLTVGDQDGTDDGDEFTGDIDEVKIYRLALTSDQVKIEFNRAQSVVYGALSTDSTGAAASDSYSREYCVPGNTSTCDPPLGDWKFEEGTGSTTADSSGNGYTGTWSGSGTRWGIGKIGKAGDFNGSDDETSHGTINMSLGALTIEAWIKPRSFKQSSPFISQIAGVEAVAGDLAIIRLGDSALAAEKPQFDLKFSAGVTRLDGVTSLSANTWYHIAGVYDGSKMYLYVNGKVDNSTSQTGTVTANTTFMIGDSAGFSGRNFDGAIDEVKIFNYGRTPTQIAWDYNRGAPVGWWKFDECQGTTANDSAGNSLSGTISAGTTGITSVGDCTTASTMWDNGESGKWNYSLDFDAADDTVTVTNASKIDFNEGLQNGVTMAAWFYADTAGEGGTGRIFAKEPAAGDGTLCYVNNLSGNNLDIYCTLDLTTTNRTVTVSSAVTTASWNHIAFTWTNDSDDDVTVYVNGKSRGSSSTNSNDTIPADTTNFTIGNNSAGSGTFDGKIDDVRIYNYELTATQVKMLYNQGSAVRFGPNTGAP